MYRVDKLFWCVMSYLGQLSLAIPLWLGVVSTSEKLGARR